MKIQGWSLLSVFLFALVLGSAGLRADQLDLNALQIKQGAKVAVPPTPGDNHLRYDQSSGRLTGTLSNGENIDVRGYSGNDNTSAYRGKNNPSAEDIENVGPIESGTYAVTGSAQSLHGKPHDNVLKLDEITPKTTDRPGGYEMHGGRKDGEETASEGCIVIDKVTRCEIKKQLDLANKGLVPQPTVEVYHGNDSSYEDAPALGAPACGHSIDCPHH